MSRTSYDKIRRYRDTRDYSDQTELTYAEMASPRLSDSILAFLLSATSRRLQRSILYEIVSARYPTSKENFRMTLHRMHKKNKIRFVKDSVVLVDAENTRGALESVYTLRIPDKTKRVMIIFDIPEEKRPLRDWLRGQLKYWDFTMVQQSVWVGYAPVPPDFRSKLKKLSLDKYVKFMEVTGVKEL